MLRKRIIGGLSISLIAALCMTALMVAATNDARVADLAMKKDKDGVRALLKQAVDVNAAQGDGMTALHWAAMNGDTELAQLLVYAGANVKATTRLGGYTPLAMASKSGNSAVVEVLLKAGADPKGAALDGLTPLMMAAWSGDVSSVKLLIEHGADVNAMESEHGQTPLAFAAAFNRADAIQELLAHGADVNVHSKIFTPSSSRTWRCPAAAAAAAPAPAGAPAAAGAAATPAAPAAAAGGRGGRGGRGGAAAPAAGAPAAAAAPAAVSTNNAQPAATPAAAATPARGQGAAPAAAGAQPAAAAAAAGAMNGADASARGGGNPQGGFTPLMYAARQGSIEAARSLIDGGAKLNEVGGDRSTALVMATINGHFDTAKLILDRGADSNLASMDGASPMWALVNTQWARKSFHPQPSTKYEKTSYLDLMNDLLDHGADPNGKLGKDLWYSEYNFSLESASAAGTGPFWKCAEVGDIDGMCLLVSRGADPNVASKDGVTALLMASGAGVHGNDDVTAPYGRLAAVKYLVEELHMDVNAADTAPAGGRGGGGAANPAQQQQIALQLATSGKQRRGAHGSPDRGAVENPPGPTGPGWIRRREAAELRHCTTPLREATMK